MLENSIRKFPVELKSLATWSDKPQKDLVIPDRVIVEDISENRTFGAGT